MDNLTEEQKNRLEKMAKFLDNTDLGFFETLEQIAEHLKTISEKELPKMEMPEVHKVKIEGIETITLKGDKGDTGEKGEQGEKGLDGKDGKNGKDGKDGLNGLDGRDGVDGKDGENGKDGSPDTPEQIREKLESLKEEARLDKSAIKGLEDEIKTLRDEITSIPRGRAGGARKVPIIKRYNLSSQCDGSTKAFTLPNDTVDVVGVWGTQFPITFNPLTDWTFAGRTLTLTGEVSAPATGQTLFCIIETLFYG